MAADHGEVRHADLPDRQFLNDRHARDPCLVIGEPGANLLQGIDVHPSGHYALITLNRTKNNVPMTRLLQGWTTDRSLEWGAWAASRVALKLGGRAGIPPLPGWLKV